MNGKFVSTRPMLCCSCSRNVCYKIIIYNVICSKYECFLKSSISTFKNVFYDYSVLLLKTNVGIAVLK